MKQLICNGDSWVFGSELVDPEIIKKYPSDMHVGNFDHLEENDSYRIPRIFPSKLASMLNADLVNLSWPADDNSSISDRTIDYITKNYLVKGLDTSELFVVIGWSSPERVRFWYKDENLSMRYIIWPSLEWHDSPEQKKIWELYVSYLWNKEEYLPRFVDTVLKTQNFFKANNIKYTMFNSFYQGGGSGCSHAIFEDINIDKELQSINWGYVEQHAGRRISHLYDHCAVWKTVDPVAYYCKDQDKNSFRTFITDRLANPLTGWHPSAEGHSIWAEELYRYITVNNLL